MGSERTSRLAASRWDSRDFLHRDRQLAHVVNHKRRSICMQANLVSRPALASAQKTYRGHTGSEGGIASWPSWGHSWDPARQQPRRAWTGVSPGAHLGNCPFQLGDAIVDRFFFVRASLDPAIYSCCLSRLGSNSPRPSSIG
jgi:hypothetical protein